MEYNPSVSWKLHVDKGALEKIKNSFIQRILKRVGLLKRDTLDKALDLLEEHFKQKFWGGSRKWGELSDPTISMRGRKVRYYKKPAAPGVGVEVPVYMWTGELMKSFTERHHKNAIRKKNYAAGTVKFGSKDPKLYKLYRKRGEDFITQDDIDTAMSKLRQFVRTEKPVYG